jgi:UDP-N-acetylglucosamine 1-carboxyvinyltransferase
MSGKYGTTVLGTDNIMMAAVLAEGTTVIEDAAEEPEVVDLANFLNALGAKITGAGTRRIVIEGVKELHGTDYTVIPDRIEAGTMLVAGAITGGTLTVNHVRPDHLESVLEPLRAAGFHLETRERSITVSPNGGLRPLHLETSPYPGFPTDMQAQMCALLIRAPGESVITDHIFPQRFMHVAELARMGAQIRLETPTAFITGNGSLSGAPVMASDLRASAALLLAGLHADGVTEVNRVYHIDRGYEHIDEKLNDVGAHIERVKA